MIHNFHIIKGSSTALAYRYPTTIIVEINEFVANVIECMQYGETLENIAKSVNVERSKLSFFLISYMQRYL
jgi:hypothetical protein